MYRMRFVPFVSCCHGLWCKKLKTVGPRNDQYQFSPNSINAFSREKVMRINKMITRGKMLSFKNILLTYSFWKCMEISMENLYVDIVA